MFLGIIKQIILITDGQSTQEGCPVTAARRARNTGAGPILKNGQTITGRWERNSYTINGLIGKGGTGLVYLVKDRRGNPRAMKISADIISITHEHRILRHLNNCDGLKDLPIIPRVMELDDLQIGGQVYHYIITQYCRGVNLGLQAGRLNACNTALVGQQVAEFLDRLHEQGFVFGDLKPGNLVYDFTRRIVHIVDFGSVTIKGQNLKQYTPGYDRLSWGAGTRVADEAYDVFALGMLLAVLMLGKTGGRNDQGLGGIISRVSRGINHPKLRETIIRILKQEVFGCRNIAGDLSVIAEEIPLMENSRC